MTTVSIIGCAGRSPEELGKLNKDLYKKVYEHITHMISHDGPLDWGNPRGIDPVELVSGGAPWVDHTAVSLYCMEEVGYLTLHLPCEWNCGGTCFDQHNRTGVYLNQLHGYFSEKMGGSIWQSLNTLNYLITSQPSRFNYHSHKGFHARNLEVAKSEIILAYTFHKGNEPKPGSGTRWTWDQATTRYKYHTNLEEL